MKKCPNEKLEVYYGDPYMEQCCASAVPELAQEKDKTEESPMDKENKNVCFVMV